MVGLQYITKHTLELVIPSRITEYKGNTLKKRFPPDLFTCKLTVLDFHEVPVIINVELPKTHCCILCVQAVTVKYMWVFMYYDDHPFHS